VAALPRQRQAAGPNGGASAWGYGGRIPEAARDDTGRGHSFARLRLNDRGASEAGHLPSVIGTGAAAGRGRAVADAVATAWKAGFTVVMPRKPTHLHVLEGTLHATRHKNRKHEPQPEGQLTDPPSWMDEEHREVWTGLRQGSRQRPLAGEG
jgi:hypothetical protein